LLTDILKIIPKMDSSDLKKLEDQLQSRFTKISKKFGKGLMDVLKGGGIAGLALGLIDKLLNPLKAVQESIDRTLKTSDDLATQANQFNTSSGKLFKLVQIGKSAGLDQEGLFTLITKFQTAVAQAKADPNDQSVSAVRNFTNEKDTALNFFNFIQSLQKLDRNQQLLVQQQVFGEKQIGKMSEFLNLDFAKQFRATGLDRQSSETFTKAIDKMAKLSDLADILKVKNENKDIIDKSRVINESMIKQRAKSDALALEKENLQIKSYNDLAAISDTVSKIMLIVEQGVGLIGKLINMVTPFINQATDFMQKFLKSPLMRGVRGLFGGGKDE
jgi:hypothetical protein